MAHSSALSNKSGQSPMNILNYPLFSFGHYLLYIFFHFLINSSFSHYNYLFILVFNFKCLTCSIFPLRLYTLRSAVAAVGRQATVVRSRAAVAHRWYHCGAQWCRVWKRWTKSTEHLHGYQMCSQ